MFKIETRNKNGKNSEEKGRKDEEGEDNEFKNKVEKIEICYFCLRKFDMNKDDLSYYKYGKYPMCNYCAEFYGFYSD